MRIKSNRTLCIIISGHIGHPNSCSVAQQQLSKSSWPGEIIHTFKREVFARWLNHPRKIKCIRGQCTSKTTCQLPQWSKWFRLATSGMGKLRVYDYTDSKIYNSMPFFTSFVIYHLLDVQIGIGFLFLNNFSKNYIFGIYISYKVSLVAFFS